MKGSSGAFRLVGEIIEIKLLVEDEAGGPAAGIPVHFYIEHDPAKPSKMKKERTTPSAFLGSTGEKVPHDIIVKTNAEGVAAVPYQLGSKAGSYGVSASLEGNELAGKPPYFENKAGVMLIIILTLLGGLGMFIFGMNLMGDSLQKWVGEKMQAVLGFFTRNRVIALISGIVITFILQSSSATTVLLVGFVNSGLMTMAQTIGVILGADIGTTLTVQLIAFDVGQYALGFVFFGFVFTFFTKNKTFNYLGKVLMGFGLLFYGLKVMGGSMKPLAKYEPFVNALRASTANPLLGLLVSTALTAVIQSSAATIAIALGLASQGIIGIDAAIPIIFGANIGTTVTAALACIGTSRSAKRVAMAHTMFKVAGVVLFMVLFTYMGRWIAGQDYLAMIVLKMGGSITRQIANAHTIFNVAMALIFLPFSHLFANVVMKVLPEVKEKEEMFKPKYIVSDLTATPQAAIEQTEKELGRLADIAVRMSDSAIEAFKKKDEEFVEGLIQEENHVVILENVIRPYLAKIGSRELNVAQSKRVLILMNILNEYHEIGKVVSQDILPMTEEFMERNLFFSPEGWEQLRDFGDKVARDVRDATTAFKENNTKLAEEVTLRKQNLVKLEKQYTKAHFERLAKGHPESVETSTLHMSLMSGLRRLLSFATNIAYAVMGEV
ncbi:MAG: Na/Pi symporter [Candidatus Tritonobacter lacicola]|nr:Na/Pi symporter [Candidatus Tritonobacter lacicola]